ncbi:hypothetical protein M8J77_021395 [Diaphorina citri]|nr:hypothetical protein M8J77_021395 [Diaphorina citri]
MKKWGLSGDDLCDCGSIQDEAHLLVCPNAAATCNEQDLLLSLLLKREKRRRKKEYLNLQALVQTLNLKVETSICSGCGNEEKEEEEKEEEESLDEEEEKEDEKEMTLKEKRMDDLKETTIYLLKSNVGVAL